MHAIQFTAGDGQLARLFRAAGECHGVELRDEVLRRDRHTDVRIRSERHAFLRHLLHARDCALGIVEVTPIDHAEAVEQLREREQSLAITLHSSPSTSHVWVVRK